MKLFWYEIRKAVTDNSPNIYKKSWGVFGNIGEVPVSNLDLLYSIYRKNTDSRRAISLIAKNIWLEGYYFQIWEDTVEDAKSTAILEFNNFRNIISEVVRDIAVSWNAYIVKLRNASGQVIWLDTIDPRTVKIRATKQGEITAYEQRVAGQAVNRYEPKDIVNCFDETDPDNEIFGLSVLESIIYDTLADSEAALANYFYFKNSAIPARLLIAKDNASQEELENTVTALRKNFSWWQNKHKIGILQGIERIEQIQDSLSDMQFLALRNFTTERVCVAFDVPKVVLWYTDGVNFSNHEWQYRKFIQNTITSREKNIQSWINEALEQEQWYFNFYSLKFDIDKEWIDILEVKVRNWLITPNEARQELWYEAVDVPEANQLLISKNYDRLEDIWLSMIQTNDS